MDNQDKLEQLRLDVAKLHGNVETLTTVVGIYQAQLTKVEGRQWGSMLMGLTALIGAILSFVMSKH